MHPISIQEAAQIYLKDFTTTEKKVARMLTIDCLRPRAVANMLCVQLCTVVRHRDNIFEKLQMTKFNKDFNHTAFLTLVVCEALAIEREEEHLREVV